MFTVPWAPQVKGEALVEPVAKGSVLRLLSLLKPEKGPLAVAVGTLLATTGTSLVLPAVSEPTRANFVSLCCVAIEKVYV